MTRNVWGMALAGASVLPLTFRVSKTDGNARVGNNNDNKNAPRADIAAALTALLADAFASYLKTKNFYWQASRLPFSEYQLMLDVQAKQLLGMIDILGEQAHRIGGTTLRSIGHVARLQSVTDNDADFVAPLDMLLELKADNERLITTLRTAHDLCVENNDVATAIIKNAIDDAEGRIWFLSEATKTTIVSAQARAPCSGDFPVPVFAGNA